MIRTALLSLLLHVAFLSPLSAALPGPGPIDEALPFGDGEKLEYKVWYNWTAVWIAAGALQFSVRAEDLGGEPVWHARCLGRTQPSFDRVFAVRDRYETWIDAQSFEPRRFERDVNEGGYTFYRSYDFEPRTRSATSHFRRLDRVRDNELSDLPVGVQDLLSAAYRLRTIDVDTLEPGDRVPLPMVIDGKLHALYVRWIGRETKKTRSGTFRTLVFRPMLLEGDYFKEGEGLTIWLSDDANRVPLRAEAEILLGSLKADLVSYSGLKHAFDARLR